MDQRRRQVLAIIGASPLYAKTPPSLVFRAKELTPIAPPVEQPPPPQIQRAEELIRTALTGTSEDKPINLDEIYRRVPELKSISDANVQLALRDLLWKEHVEEVDDKNPPVYR